MRSSKQLSFNDAVGAAVEHERFCPPDNQNITPPQITNTHITNTTPNTNTSIVGAVVSQVQPPAWDGFFDKLQNSLKDAVAGAIDGRTNDGQDSPRGRGRGFRGRGSYDGRRDGMTRNDGYNQDGNPRGDGYQGRNSYNRNPPDSRGDSWRNNRGRGSGRDDGRSDGRGRGNKANMECFRCGKYGHFQWECRSGNNRSNN